MSGDMKLTDEEKLAEIRRLAARNNVQHMQMRGSRAQLTLDTRLEVLQIVDGIIAGRIHPEP